MGEDLFRRQDPDWVFCSLRIKAERFRCNMLLILLANGFLFWLRWDWRFFLHFGFLAPLSPAALFLPPLSPLPSSSFHPCPFTAFLLPLVPHSLRPSRSSSSSSFLFRSLSSAFSSFYFYSPTSPASPLLPPPPPPPLLPRRRLLKPITSVALLGSSLILPTWVNCVSCTLPPCVPSCAVTLPLSLLWLLRLAHYETASRSVSLQPSFSLPFFFPLFPLPPSPSFSTL